MHLPHKLLFVLLSTPSLIFGMQSTEKEEQPYPAYPLQAVLELDAAESNWFIEKPKPLSPDLMEESLARAPRQVQGLAKILGNPALFKAYKPKDLVLKGTYSVGKRTLAQALAQKNGLTCTTINAFWLGNICKKSGEERLVRLVDLSLKDKSEPHVMIIRAAETKTSSGETATLWQLLQKYRTNRNIYFIFTVEDYYELHHLIAQECTIVPLAKPDKATREKELSSFVANYKTSTFSSEDSRCIAQKTEDFSFNDLNGLCGEAFGQAAQRAREQKNDGSKLSKDSINISLQDFEITLKNIAKRKKDFERARHGQNYTTPALVVGATAATLFIVNRIVTHK